MKKYPKQIYVQYENEETKDEFLNATTKPEEVIYDDKVAVYVLKEVLTKQTKIVIE